MRFLSQDQKVIDNLAQQHGVSQNAVTALWEAIQVGRGRAAQFNHPELGGMGQWMAGGMTMIGDFSNYRLQATVAEICAALAAHLQRQAAEPAPAQQQTQSSGAMAHPRTAVASRQSSWWPSDLGTPSGSGSQNKMHYAYFHVAKRLVLRIDNCVTVYDTADHQITGVSQQQDGQQSVSFRSQKGELAVAQLKKLLEYTL